MKLENLPDKNEHRKGWEANKASEEENNMVAFICLCILIILAIAYLLF